MREPPLSIEEFEQTLAGYDEILDQFQLNRSQSQVHIQQFSKVEAAKPVVLDVVVERLEQLELKVNKILKQLEEQDGRKRFLKYKTSERTPVGKPVCYACGKPGHMARLCPKETNTHQPYPVILEMSEIPTVNLISNESDFIVVQEEVLKWY